MEKLEIVRLIEKNPLTKFTCDYKSRLVNKVKDAFTNDEQHIFLSNFYCYLNYDSENDFVVDLDDIWKWMGFSRRDNSKNLLNKYFKEDIDYKVLLLTKEEQKKGRGGKNKKKILMTIDTFKAFCLSSRTEKASIIHGYYIKLEKIINQLIEEDSEELRRKFIEQQDKYEEKLALKDQEIKDNISDMENTLLKNSSGKTLVYLGLVEDNIVKFGYSKGIERRVLRDHKKDFNEFVLKYTIHTTYYIDLEDKIKMQCECGKSVLKDRRLSKVYNGKNQTELIRLDDNFTVVDLYSEIVKLNDELVNERESLKNNKIQELRNSLNSANNRIKFLEKTLKDNNIDIGQGSLKSNNVDLYISMYFFKFIRYLCIDKISNDYVWFTNDDFYRLYREYVLNISGDILYVMTFQKLGYKCSDCPYIIPARQTYSRNDSRYIKGKDNRVKGKKLLFSDNLEKWINENLSKIEIKD